MKRTLWDNYLSGNEALAQMMTGSIAEPVAGWGGALAMLGSMNPATGAAATEKIRNALTYQPRDAYVMDRFAQLVAPVVERYEAGKEWMGEGALNATGSPAAATAAYAAPDALLALLGARAGGMKPPSPARLERLAAQGPGGFAGSGQKGQIAWHGTPHQFDAFDSSHMGKGEGAQAYGHGLYFAESPGVADSYRKALGGGDSFAPKVKNEASQMVANYLTDARSIDEAKSEALRRLSRDLENAKEYQRADPNDVGLNAWIADAESSIGTIEGLTVDDFTQKKTGHLYKTDIPDEAVERMLDWDKPLSEQHPDVQLALEALRESAQKTMPQIAEGDPAGRGIYAAYQAHRGGNQAAVSDRLRQLGIPGIRYLDGNSRDGGSGTRNFVTFDDSLIRILERNGQPTGRQPWKPGEWKR